MQINTKTSSSQYTEGRHQKQNYESAADNHISLSPRFPNIKCKSLYSEPNFKHTTEHADPALTHAQESYHALLITKVRM